MKTNENTFRLPNRCFARKLTCAILASLGWLRSTLAVVTLALGLLVDHSSAGVYFRTGFDSPTLDPNLEDADIAFAIEGGSTHLKTPFGERHYLRTVFSDYMSLDFIAELTLTITEAPDATAWAIAFFGVGSGVPWSRCFGEVTPSLVLRMHPPDDTGGGIEANFWEHCNDFDGLNLHLITASYGTHRATIIKQGDTVTFQFDENYDGAFRPDGSVTFTNVQAQAPWLGSANSRIFFGTGQPVDIFDDFVVWPLSPPSNAPPTVFIHPKDQQALAGTTVKLDMEAYGAEPLHYQWRFNETDLTGANIDTLTLANVQKSNEGNYDVVVTNNFGSVTSRVAVLTVRAAATRYVWQESPNPAPPYTTWATAARNIQDAVDVAIEGDTVLVTNGVCNVNAVIAGDGHPSRVALTKPILLQSVNGPEVTVIDGAPHPDWDTNSAIRCVYVGADAILSGFTLTNGYATIGGGVRAESSGVVSNCIIRGNSAGEGSWAIGGGAYGGILRDCILTGNSSTGEGGGAWGATLYNCVLRKNSASGLGGGAQSSALRNCLVTENFAQGSGGGASGCSLYHCTVTLNASEEGGGGIGGSYVENSIVYHNTSRRGRPNYPDASGLEPSSPEVTFRFSCTTPLPPGDGNFEADPQLGSATHLSAGSPCIGTGNATNTTGVDIDGEPWGDPPCMGADQFTSGHLMGPIRIAIRADYSNTTIGLPIRFTGEFEGLVTSNIWEFGDGTSVTNQPATTHAWNTFGTYTVTLRAFNESFPQGVASQLQIAVVEPPVHYVNRSNATPAFPYASWPTAATNIQDAVDAAASTAGSVVLVTNGIYDTGGGVNGSRVALTNPVVLRSMNGPAVTTIVGRQDDWLRCAYVGANAMLSGFTLTNGAVFGSIGAGVWSEPSGLVSNCTLIGNTTYCAGGGGGVFGGAGAFGGVLRNCVLAGNQCRTWPWCEGYVGFGGGARAAVLYDCELIGNSSGAGGGAYGCILYNCTLTGNSGWRSGNVAYGGGGAYESTLYSCVLTGNSGHGVIASTLSNCVVTSNEGWGALGSTLYNSTVTSNSEGGVTRFTDWDGEIAATLHNCVVTGNAGWGASGSILYNCTVTGNSAGGVTGGTLYNCIVYHNTADGGFDHIGDSIFESSCTTPLPAGGSGNIAIDPRFENIAAGDYRLRPDSPCIDAGINLSELPATDFAGLPRALDGNGDGIVRVDMGACEFNPYRFAPTLALGPDGFRFTVRGEPGKSVIIERSRDLIHWEFAGQVPIPASGQTLIDPVATTERQLFYRVMFVP